MNIFLGCLFEFDPTIDWSGIATVAAVLVALLAVFWPQIHGYFSRPVLEIRRKETYGDQYSTTIGYHLVVEKIKGDSVRNCRIYLSHMLKWINNKWEHWPVYYKRPYPWTPEQHEPKMKDIVNEASFDFLFLVTQPMLCLRPGILHGQNDERFFVQPNEPVCFIIEIETESHLAFPTKKYVMKVTWNGEVRSPQEMEEREILKIEQITDNSEIQKILKDYDRDRKSQLPPPEVVA